MRGNKLISCDEFDKLNDKIKRLSDNFNDLESKFSKELSRQNEIIESQQEILNILLSNKDVKHMALLETFNYTHLKILKFIVNICNKHNIIYWLDFGSLVDAIRHEGFVPWDDEAVIAMPREDYEKFIKIIHKELEIFPDIKERISVSRWFNI